MDNFDYDYDKWKTTPPDEEETTACKCAECGCDLFYDEAYYEIDGRILCEECADDWMFDHKHWVTDYMARGD